MSRRRLYYLALFLGLAGQIWIFYSYHKLEKHEEAFNTCIFKAVTGIPCPSCGTVHSIISILHGNFRQALTENPIGFAGLLALAVVPYWILADLYTGRESFYRFFMHIDGLLRKKRVLIPLLLTVLLIWIYKLSCFYGFLH